MRGRIAVAGHLTAGWTDWLAGGGVFLYVFDLPAPGTLFVSGRILAIAVRTYWLAGFAVTMNALAFFANTANTFHATISA